MRPLGNVKFLYEWDWLNAEIEYSSGGPLQDQPTLSHIRSRGPMLIIYPLWDGLVAGP